MKCRSRLAVQVMVILPLRLMLSLRRKIGNGAFHEAVEERDREGGVAMRRAIRHAFPDQLAANRRDGGHPTAKEIGDVAPGELCVKVPTRVNHRHDPRRSMPVAW